MQDEVECAVIGGFLAAPFVARDLRRIFLHRHRSLAIRFPGGGTDTPAIDMKLLG